MMRKTGFSRTFSVPIESERRLYFFVLTRFLDANRLHFAGKRSKRALHGVALKEPFAADPIRRANDGARPALQVANHPAADRLEISGEIELCHAIAVTDIGPQLLVGL